MQNINNKYVQINIGRQSLETYMQINLQHFTHIFNQTLFNLFQWLIIYFDFATFDFICLYVILFAIGCVKHTKKH